MPGQTVLLTRREAAARLDLQEQTLAAWASRDYGPPFVKLGRAVRYPADELEAWLLTQIVRPGGRREAVA